MERKKGIVAMLDILGYSSLIENNDIGDNTAKILDLINSLPKAEIEEQGKKFENNKESKTKEIITGLSFLVFSDTILLTLELDETKNTKVKGSTWAIALLTLTSLFKKFMDYGLPLRGAVSYGEYITRDFCFAGKPIINAYRKGNSLNSAGIVLDEYALAEILKCVSEEETLKDMIAVNPLICKTRENAEETNYFVSLFLSYSKPERITLSNPRELTIYLTKSFTAHNKGLDDHGKIKLDNTIFLFEQAFKYKSE